MLRSSDIFNKKLIAPFPYFGGKAKIASIVWEALGQPKYYIEPFFGSGAVLLARPNYDPQKYLENICDKDGFVANVWRALQFAPDEVARWCDWPVNHADLTARRIALLNNEQRLLQNLTADPEWYDTKLAGYWIWAASCWIGSGLRNIKVRPNISSGNGVHKSSNNHNNIDIGKDVKEPYSTNIYAWFRALSERLRYVRVVCDDWTSVCKSNWHKKFNNIGVFFDPPYGVKDRSKTIYHCDSLTVADDVRKWCLERGSMPEYKIVLAGYDEHKELLDAGWTAYYYKAHGGYAHLGNGIGKKNRYRETLYFSPNCEEVQHERL